MQHDLAPFVSVVLLVTLEIFLGLCLTALLAWVYAHLYPRLQKTHLSWDHVLLEALYLPLRYLLWALIFSLIVFQLGLFEHFEASTRYLTTVWQFVFVIFLIAVSIRFVNRLEKELAQRQFQLRQKTLDPSSIHAFFQLFRFLVLLIGVLMTMAIYGVPIGPLLTVGGVGGVALSFAAKDTLANVLGGFMIYFDRAFGVGDWIRSSDREIEGTVEYIGWRQTRIRTLDKRALYVPNSIFSTISVENPSRMTHRRIKFTAGVRYEDIAQLPAILKEIAAALRAHPQIDVRESLYVNLYELGESSLNFWVYAFTKATDSVQFQAIQQEILFIVLQIIAEHHAECAFPTRTLLIPEGFPGAPGKNFVP